MTLKHGLDVQGCFLDFRINFKIASGRESRVLRYNIPDIKRQSKYIPEFSNKYHLQTIIPVAKSG